MDALVPGEVPEARFVLTYQQRNITHDISKNWTSISYSDFLTGQADTLDIELEDTEEVARCLVSGAWRRTCFVLGVVRKAAAYAEPPGD